MAFTRDFLRKHGVPEENIDAIMAERNRTLGDYVPKADVQAQIDAALAAQKPPEIDPTTTEPYQALLRERDMLRAVQGEDFAQVKPKFREQVFGMLDRGPKALSMAQQLQAIAEKYEEYFIPTEQPKKPQFGASTQGGMPRGDQSAQAAFLAAWGKPQKE